MNAVSERVPLALHTTLRVGGEARFFVTCTSAEEVVEALAYATQHALPVAMLGGGANTLVPDEGFEGLVIKIAIEGLLFKEEGDAVIATVGAGVSWDVLVREATLRGLWGIENLAGIPGTVGGAVVQNIGAYGAELSESCIRVEVRSLPVGAESLVERADAHFAYRTSVFKQNHSLVVTRATFTLSRHGLPKLSYPDLVKAKERGEPLSTPGEIADAVRCIRSKKFPQEGGTAGSFFKNPIVSKERTEVLLARYPEMPHFKNENGVKLALAWILDNVLHLKGYQKGHVRLFESQPLVLVTEPGATSTEVDVLASEVAQKVKEVFDIALVREVETLSAR